MPVGDWCWNELSTPDVQRSLAFYAGVFGYRQAAMPRPQGGSYFILNSADGRSRAGVSQAQDPGGPAMWRPYVRVEDSDAIAARVAPLGGKLSMVPVDIPGVGRIGALADPLGAVLGFIQPAVRA
jgi:predicted enzyme related to lactoylglutathione lyase